MSIAVVDVCLAMFINDTLTEIAVVIPPDRVANAGAILNIVELNPKWRSLNMLVVRFAGLDTDSIYLK
jgi:hypothetical protein